MSVYYTFLDMVPTTIHRENAGESVAGNPAELSLGEAPEGSESATQKSKSSSFDILGVDPADVGMEDEEDFGGLMVGRIIILLGWSGFGID